MNVSLQAIYEVFLPAMGAAFLIPLVFHNILRARRLRIVASTLMPAIVFYGPPAFAHDLHPVIEFIMLIIGGTFLNLPFVLLGEGAILLWRKVRRKG